MLLVPIIAAVIIYYLLAGGKSQKIVPVNQDLPLEELKKRFVMGEIDEETYLRMKRVISE